MYIKWHWLSFNLHIAFNPFDITTNSTLWSIPYRWQKTEPQPDLTETKASGWPLLPCDFNKSWQGPGMKERGSPGWGTWGLGPTLMACTAARHAPTHWLVPDWDPRLLNLNFILPYQFTQPCLNYRYKYMLEDRIVAHHCKKAHIATKWIT